MEHRYTRTSDAYDACQCDESVETGDLLIIERERVVGLAWAWPVAVTLEVGELHSVAHDGDAVRLATDAGWTRAQLDAAIAVADAHDWPVNSKWRVAGNRQL